MPALPRRRWLPLAPGSVELAEPKPTSARQTAISNRCGSRSIGTVAPFGRPRRFEGPGFAFCSGAPGFPAEELAVLGRSGRGTQNPRLIKQLAEMQLLGGSTKSVLRYQLSPIKTPRSRSFQRPRA